MFSSSLVKLDSVLFYFKERTKRLSESLTRKKFHSPLTSLVIVYAVLVTTVIRLRFLLCLELFLLRVNYP